MNENQETRSESYFSHDQTGSGVNVSVGAPVNSTKSKLGLILKELREINATLSKLEARQSKLVTRQSKLETGQSKLETGQSKLETGQSKLETGQSKLEARQSKLLARQSKLETKVETGLNVLDTKVTAWFSNL